MRAKIGEARQTGYLKLMRTQKGVKAEEWVVDSGATTHMTWDKGVFVTYAAMEDMPSVRLGDTQRAVAEW